MKVYTIKLTGNEFYTVVDLLTNYIEECRKDSENATDDVYRRVSKECMINAMDIKERMLRSRGY